MKHRAKVTHRWWILAILLFTGNFLMAANPANPGCGGNLTQNCLKDLDCAGGEYCQSGTCTTIKKPITCTANSCKTGEYCHSDGTCKPNAKKTCTASSCKTGEYCHTDGTCKPKPTVPPSCNFPQNKDGTVGKPALSIKILDKYHAANDTALALSPDGSLIASVTDVDDIRVWDAQTGKNRYSWSMSKMVGSSSTRPKLVFSPDGSALYANVCWQDSGNDGPGNSLYCSELKGWTLKDGKAIDTTQRYGSKVYMIAFSPNMKYAVTLMDNQKPKDMIYGGIVDPVLVAWDNTTHKRIHTFLLGRIERPASRNNRDVLCQSDAGCLSGEYCKADARGTKFCYLKTRQAPHIYLPRALTITNSGLIYSADAMTPNKGAGELYRWDPVNKSQKKLTLDTNPLSFNSIHIRTDEKIGAFAAQSHGDNLPQTDRYTIVFVVDLKTLKIQQQIKLPTPSTGAIEALQFTRGTQLLMARQYYNVANWITWVGQSPFLPFTLNWAPPMFYASHVGWSQDLRTRASMNSGTESHINIWRCLDPCKGVSCNGGQMCRFGRCVNPTPECQSGSSRPCYNGGQSSLNVGQCKAGAEFCEDGYWRGQCIGETIPTQETCNGKDSDCNGQNDDTTCECKPGDRRACYTGPAATKGKGTCQEGYQYCDSFGSWEKQCSAQRLPSYESCDNKDNDCDGLVDENITESCRHACGTGVRVCKNGSWGVCTCTTIP